MDFLNTLTTALDKNEYAISIFIDLSKAFDTIDYSILLKKLYHYEFRDQAYNIIHSYLTDRLQYVSHDNVTSSMLPISHGVPQGSILGPLLFLLYINDIYRTSSLLYFILFADDTAISVLHQT